MKVNKNEIVDKPDITLDSLTYAAVEDPDQKQGSQVIFQQNIRNPDLFCNTEQQCHPSATEILKMTELPAIQSVQANPSITLLMQELLEEVFNHCEEKVDEWLEYMKERCK